MGELARRAEGQQFKRNRVPEPKLGLQFPIEEMEPHQRELLKNPKENEFDLRVHIRDPKTGELLKYQPYRLEISQANGEKYYRKDEQGVERCYSATGKLLEKAK